jgi:hypothetical protein
MTAQALIEQLTNLIAHGLNPKAIVKSYNGDTEQLEEVSGLLYDNEQVEICTDDMGG